MIFPNLTTILDNKACAGAITVNPYDTVHLHVTRTELVRNQRTKFEYAYITSTGSYLDNQACKRNAAKKKLRPRQGIIIDGAKVCVFAYNLKQIINWLIYAPLL